MFTNQETLDLYRFGKWSTQLIACVLVMLVSSTGICQEPMVKAPVEVLDAFGLAEAQIVEMDVEFVPNQPVVESVLIDGAEYVFELHPHVIRSKDFVLKVQLEDGSFEIQEPAPSRTYRGLLRGSKGSTVAASITDKGLGAKITMGDGKVFFMEPVSTMMEDPAFAGTHIVYRSGATLATDAVCGVGENAKHWEQIRLENELRRARRIPNNNHNPDIKFGTSGFSVAEIAIDADFEFFQSQGSTVQGTINRMELILNIVNQQYESQVSITHAISAAIVRSSQPDPYTTSDAGGLLSQVQSEWLSNQGSVQRDVVHMFTGRGLNGSTIGVAFLGQICNIGGHYGLVESNCCGALVCSTDLSAHELGHNWNAGHCGCPGNTMNSGLTCSNNFTPASITTISNFRDSRTCLDGVAQPPNDNFADSINIGSLPATNFGTNVNGTTEAGEPNLTDTGSTVWWSRVAPADGMMTVDTFGSTFDTVLQIFTGNSVTNLTPVAGNDDANGTAQSQITFPVNGGQRYEIRVGGFTKGGGAASSGSVTLNTSFAPEGPRDFFLSTRSQGQGAFNTSNADATVTTGQSGSIYVYFDPTNGDVDTGAFFDVQTSEPGVIEFTTATSFDFDILVSGTPFSVRWGDAFGETGTVTADTIDEWGAFAVVEGQGMLTQNTGPTFFDEGYDMSSGAFLFGRIDFNVVGPAGSSVDIVLSPGATGIVNMDSPVDAGIGSINLTVDNPLPPTTDFFWSFADFGDGAANDSMPTGTFAEGSMGSMFLYYDPIFGDVDTGAFFDLLTSADGVIEFTNATSFDFDITVDGTAFDVRWGDAFGETGTVTPNMIDEWGAFAVVGGTGMVAQNTGPTFFDEGYDAAAGAFLFGRVDFAVVGNEGDSVDVITSIGSTGIVNMAMSLDPSVGIATVTVGESTFLLGDVNCDGEVNLLDVAPLVDLITSGGFSTKADINEDGNVDLLDVGPFVDLLIDG